MYFASSASAAAICADTAASAASGSGGVDCALALAGTAKSRTRAIREPAAISKSPCKGVRRRANPVVLTSHRLEHVCAEV